MNNTETILTTDNLFVHAIQQVDVLSNNGSLGEQAALALRQLALQSKTILTIDEAAELLHCAVSTLQTMPIDELPTYEGVGRNTYYLKSDLEEFVRKRRRTVKRGTGLGKRLNVIDHLPAAGVENPALEALKQL